MGGEEKIYEDKILKKNDDVLNYQWVIMEDGNDICDFESSESSSLEGSINVSSSSLDLMEDATSSTSSSSSPSDGPLYELSELMAQLPIKRGLSKYYQGKSQTFGSLASVKSLEDLAKKGRRPYRRKVKSCKSYGGGLDNHIYSPKAAISKKTSRVSLLSSLGRRETLFSSCRTSISIQKNL
ncbi:hypothetical protein LOK49_LG13G00715 [Camellia lanceoleosa]|uniref:Uncharacterized protein n=1 Tax=Camellia lanceoleosa TaxID=1840588 RepID=A0ACC0FLP3_9ERIC|nr:hypothetical protein LOK49_LG13G00715 [Camellia lanceoleosa]